MAKKTSQACYTKRDILISEKYKNKRDILNVILKDNAYYTLEDINKLLETFLKKEVKFF